MAYVTSRKYHFFRVWLVGTNQEAEPLHRRRPFPDCTALSKMAYYWLCLFAASFFDLFDESAHE